MAFGNTTEYTYEFVSALEKVFPVISAHCERANSFAETITKRGGLVRDECRAVPFG